MTTRQYVYALIDAERRHQTEKHGKRTPQYGDQWRSLVYVAEEVGEVARALQDDRSAVLSELVDVAALCVAWAEGLLSGTVDTHPSPYCDAYGCENEARYTSGLCGVCDVVHNEGKGERR